MLVLTCLTFPMLLRLKNAGEISVCVCVCVCVCEVRLGDLKVSFSSLQSLSRVQLFVTP